jgi:epoxide hydrolase-like predicted phosphatase
MVTHQIRAVIWDLGGVILRTEDLGYRSKWEARTGLGPWDLEKAVFRSEMSKLASMGKASTQEIWDSLQVRFGLLDDEIAEFQVDFLAGDHIDDDLMTFIRGLRKQYKIGMITNAWPDIRQWMEQEVKIADAFDHIVVSSEVGMVKPTSDIYHLSLAGLGVRAEESLFVDDFIENIEGAKGVGMHTIHFQDPHNFMDAITKYLGLA